MPWLKRFVAVLSVVGLLSVLPPSGVHADPAIPPINEGPVKRVTQVLVWAGNYVLCVAMGYLRGSQEPCVRLP